MYHELSNYCNALTKDFDSIKADRKVLLEKIGSYISAKIKEDKPVNLVYICTHNSRRSHFGQVWAHVAANYYEINNVNTFSGGTEATAFNHNAINALKRAGFKIEATDSQKNTSYKVFHDDAASPSLCFSKVFNDPVNPQKEFAAIMTCSDAEENCPFIPGAELRIGTTYEDPKVFDNTALKDIMYDERCKQIALESFYVFSKV